MVDCYYPLKRVARIHFSLHHCTGLTWSCARDFQLQTAYEKKITQHDLKN